VKRSFKFIGAVLLTLVIVIGGLAWYVASLPWRNACAATLTNAATEPTNTAVATSQPLATAAAATILRHGGTAVDAAIAAALALAVAEPGNSGLGGGGFALVYDPKDKQTTSLDFRERAPIGLDLASLKDEVKENPDALRNGSLAVAVPSEWDGLLDLHRRFGKLPLSDLAAPAIAAARDGIRVTAEYSARCFVRSSVLSKNADATRIFKTAIGICPLPGWTLRQPELAYTLRSLVEGKAFNDIVGHKMVAFLRAQGSQISEEDLQRAHVTERPTVQGEFMGRTIVSMGPPSSGGLIVISLLQAYERVRALHPDANRYHLWVEASRLSFFDRARAYGDPDFVHFDAARFASGAYADEQARRIGATATIDLPATVPQADEGDHTAHISVVDKNGLAVAMTVTINLPFGSGLVVPGTGVLLNNEMDDFFLDRPNAFDLVGNARNAPAPGKRPLSSMAPTMVFDRGQLQIVMGSPGGSSIPSAVAQVIRSMVEDGSSGDAAVRAGRLHHQWLPAALDVEPYFDRSALPDDLRAIAKKPMFPIGRVQMVWLSNSGFRGVSDCRDQGEPFAAQLP
jgi:gamma-glutamyltranspeptidase/glutathione hydrolase